MVARFRELAPWWKEKQVGEHEEYWINEKDEGRFKKIGLERKQGIGEQSRYHHKAKWLQHGNQDYSCYPGPSLKSQSEDQPLGHGSRDRGQEIGDTPPNQQPKKYFGITGVKMPAVGVEAGGRCDKWE